MRRILTVAVVAVGGLLAVSAAASADVGDVRELTVDNDLFGSASEVEVTGTIRCQRANLDFGLWSAVGQSGGGLDAGTFFARDDGDQTLRNAEAEAVGAFGPSFDPPVGISDNSPCSQSLQGYDVLVQQNRDSGDFEGEQGGDNELGVVVMAGTSAENGFRGPGPFIGDMLIQTAFPSYERVR